jgi:hypothetical protein
LVSDPKLFKIHDLLGSTTLGVDKIRNANYFSPARGVVRILSDHLRSFIQLLFPHSYYRESTVKVKGKVVPVLFLTKHYAVKAYWGSGSIARRIL